MFRAEKGVLVFCGSSSRETTARAVCRCSGGRAHGPSAPCVVVESRRARASLHTRVRRDRSSSRFFPAGRRLHPPRSTRTLLLDWPSSSVRVSSARVVGGATLAGLLACGSATHFAIRPLGERVPSSGMRKRAGASAPRAPAFIVASPRTELAFSTEVGATPNAGSRRASRVIPCGPRFERLGFAIRPIQRGASHGRAKAVGRDRDERSRATPASGGGSSRSGFEMAQLRDGSASWSSFWAAQLLGGTASKWCR